MIQPVKEGMCILTINDGNFSMESEFKNALIGIRIEHVASQKSFGEGVIIAVTDEEKIRIKFLDGKERLFKLNTSGEGNLKVAHNETNEHNMAINPINEIKEEKYKSEKKNNNLIFQKNNSFQDKKCQRLSVKINKQAITYTKTQIPIEIPKSNIDSLNIHFKKGKIFNSALKNQMKLSIKTPSNKAHKDIFFKEFSHSNMNLELDKLDNSDMNKEKDHSDLDLDLKKKRVQRRGKRDNSEKVIRIYNGNNISSSEFSSEKNLSENNRGTQIDNVIKENENEDDDEKFNSEVSGKKGSNNNIEKKN